MRWDEGHESPDLIDRRGEDGGSGGGGGALLRTVLTFAPMLVRHPLGILVLLIVLAGAAYLGTVAPSSEDDQQY